LGGILLVAIGVVVGFVRALDLLGADTLRVLALILAVPGGVAVMALGLTPLVRAWRMPVTPQVERHVIKETRLQQQHTIDRRAPTQAPELPAYRQPNLYPGLQSAEWRAGLLTSGQGDPGSGGWYREVRVDEDTPQEYQWGGDE
jgi:hypothetical protein